MKGLWVRIAVLLAAVSPAFPTAAAASLSSHPASARHKARTHHQVAQVHFIYRGLFVWPPHHRRSHGKVRMPLFDQYFLQTLEKERASLHFGDGTTLYMNQRTDVVLRSPHLTLVRQGEVDEVVHQGTNHKVQTATAVAAAVGTNFDVRVVRRGTYFIVAHGALQVSNAKGTVIVQANQETFVTRHHAPRPPQLVDAQTAIRWTRLMPPARLVQTVAVDTGHFEVTFPSTKPGDGRVFFGSGPGCMGVVQVATRDQGRGTTTHDVLVTGNDLPGTVGNIGITPGASYSYEVLTISSSGTEVDDNGGKCYRVTIRRR